MVIFVAILLIFLFIFMIVWAFLPILFSLPNETAQKRTDPTKDWKVQETWEDYPSPDYNAVHTYCSIAYDDSGKTFYYRTRNPELQVGDFVYVPVGARYEKRMGRIVRMQDYMGRHAPYPLERTKHVIGKVEG